MAIQLQGNGGTVAEVKGTTFRALATNESPLDYGSLGHYRHAVQLTMATTQAANSRLYEIRNSSTNLIVPTRLYVSIMAGGTVTTAYAMQLGLWRLTSFTAVDTTNTVTPTVSPRRTSMAAAPGNAQIRHVTATGVAGGMTGGTMTKDGSISSIHEAWVATAAATTFPVAKEMLDDVNGTHPFVLVQNEGLLIENVLVGSGTANVVRVTIDFSWAEVAAF